MQSIHLQALQQELQASHPKIHSRLLRLIKNTLVSSFEMTARSLKEKCANTGPNLLEAASLEASVITLTVKKNLLSVTELQKSKPDQKTIIELETAASSTKTSYASMERGASSDMSSDHSRSFTDITTSIT